MVNRADKDDIGEVVSFFVDIANHFSEFEASHLASVHFHDDDIRGGVFKYLQGINCPKTNPVVRELH